jgi:uncharacterized protein
MKNYSKIKNFKNSKPIIGMIHVKALPGTPNHSLSMEKIIEEAVLEAKIYEKYNVDGLMMENMHDIPYLNRNIGPEIVSAMSTVALSVKNSVKIPCGVQILAGANIEALSVAKAASLDFIRAEGFVFGHIGDEGYMDSCAGEILRFRKLIEAENVQIYTDIKKKHSSHSITDDVDLIETASAAKFFKSDGVIITGSSTGKEVDLDELKQLYSNVQLPVLIGSGITIENIENYWNYCDCFIVGSHFKKDGYWENPIDQIKVKNFMKKVQDLRK